MNRDIDKKIQYLRNNKDKLQDGPIEGHCMIYGEWSTTIYEFLDTLVCHPKTYKKMPKWHEDFMLMPVVNSLYSEIT